MTDLTLPQPDSRTDEGSQALDVFAQANAAIARHRAQHLTDDAVDDFLDLDTRIPE
jgi:hypothetical protein